MYFGANMTLYILQHVLKSKYVDSIGIQTKLFTECYNFVV